MNNGQGSWCYVIYLFICLFIYRQPPSLSLSSLSSSCERITRDTLWVVEFNIHSSKGPGSPTSLREMLEIHTCKVTYRVLLLLQINKDPKQVLQNHLLGWRKNIIKAYSATNVGFVAFFGCQTTLTLIWAELCGLSSFTFSTCLGFIQGLPVLRRTAQLSRTVWGASRVSAQLVSAVIMMFQRAWGHPTPACSRSRSLIIASWGESDPIRVATSYKGPKSSQMQVFLGRRITICASLPYLAYPVCAKLWSLSAQKQVNVVSTEKGLTS